MANPTKPKDAKPKADGDDFEIKESYLDSPETDIDAFDEI